MEMAGMSMELIMCYASIFEGLPRLELQTMHRFMNAHGTHVPPILTLMDFVQNFNDVLALFVANDLAIEYAGMSEREPQRFPPAPERLTTEGITRALRAMYDTIHHLGPAEVSNQIRWFTFHHMERGACQGHIRRFLTTDHSVRQRPAPVHGGAQLTLGARDIHAALAELKDCAV